MYQAEVLKEAELISHEAFELLKKEVVAEEDGGVCLMQDGSVLVAYDCFGITCYSPFNNYDSYMRSC